MLDSGKSPSARQSLLPVETLQRLGDDLVAHADELERLGLVDYQMGVAEEEIVKRELVNGLPWCEVHQSSVADVLLVLGECIDLLSTDEEDIPEKEAGGS